MREIANVLDCPHCQASLEVTVHLSREDWGSYLELEIDRRTCECDLDEDDLETLADEALDLAQ